MTLTDRGSFGYVDEVELYNAVGIKCSGQYARKTFSHSKESENTYDPNFLLERFTQEAKLQAILGCKHTNIAPIYLYNLTTSPPWFIMELADCNLQKEISDNQLTENQKMHIIKMVLQGINYMHNQGIIHRDIKPQNILKFSDNIYKISDFGLIKNMNNTATPLTAIGVVMGTEEYIAPEIRSAAQYSHLSDIYALGIVIQKLNMQELENIMLKCVQHMPNYRYQSVQEIINELP